MLSGDTPVPVWLGLVVVILALIGGHTVAWWVHDGIAAGWEWLRRNRVNPLLEDGTVDDELGCDCCEDAGYSYAYSADGVCAQCGHSVSWHLEREELPPERSREELGFTGEQPVLEGILWEPPSSATHYPDGRRRGFTYGNGNGREPAPLPGEPQYLTASSERFEPAWRAEIAAAEAWWEELPSGTGFTRAMAARVRELAQ